MKKVLLIVLLVLGLLGAAVAGFFAYLTLSVPEDKPAQMTEEEIHRLGDALDGVLEQPADTPKEDIHTGDGDSPADPAKENAPSTPLAP